MSPAGPDLVRPAYGHRSLADLLPGVAARLGVPGSSDDLLGLPPAERYVVVLVDGLGVELLHGARRSAPYLAGLLAGAGEPLTSGVPSTTATSLGSLGTGLPPGQHGLVGYTARVPGTAELLNALTWESAVSPVAYQPRPTVFEWAAADGVAVTAVSLERFRGSGLTRAALRGPEYRGVGEDDDERWAAAVVAAAVRGPRSLTYAYERALDHVGHGDGCGSAAWRARLSAIDDRCDRLREELPGDVRLLVTGDHGMVDVPPDRRLLVEDEPELLAGVDALAGEGRFRQLYVDTDAPSAVAARWADRLGPDAWVRTRDQAVDDGWFGPVDERVRDRYGHVLVALRSDAAVLTRRFPGELDLVGMHGSLTPAEMLVPLLAD